MEEKFRGVHPHKDGGFVVTIGRRYVGYFRRHKDAVSARISAEIDQTGKPYEIREVEVQGDISLIPLHGQKGVFYGYAKIDTDDLDMVMKTSWTKDPKGYAVGRPKGSPGPLPMHRLLIYGFDKSGTTDHINGDRLDNRRSNLRKCTAKENSRNSRIAKNNTSGKKGVTKTPEGRWKAKIWVNRKEIHLGHYDTKEEAAAAYDGAAIIYHGEFASTNASLEKQKLDLAMA